MPIGGGGLVAGTALAVKYFGDDCSVIGTEPFEVDDAYRSLISGKIESNTTTNTIADGLKTQLGDNNLTYVLFIIGQYLIRINRLSNMIGTFTPFDDVTADSSQQYIRSGAP